MLICNNWQCALEKAYRFLLWVFKEHFQKTTWELQGRWLDHRCKTCASCFYLNKIHLQARIATLEATYQNDRFEYPAHFNKAIGWTRGQEGGGIWGKAILVAVFQTVAFCTIDACFVNNSAIFSDRLNISSLACIFLKPRSRSSFGYETHWVIILLRLTWTTGVNYRGITMTEVCPI